MSWEDDQDEIVESTREISTLRARVEELEGGAQSMQQKVAFLSKPVSDEFWTGITHEIAYQRSNWGEDHDFEKTDTDWFWLLCHLGTKAMMATNDRDKLRHRLIATAAVLANWYSQRPDGVAVPDFIAKEE